MLCCCPPDERKPESFDSANSDETACVRHIMERQSGCEFWEKFYIKSGLKISDRTMDDFVDYLMNAYLLELPDNINSIFEDEFEPQSGAPNAKINVLPHEEKHTIVSFSDYADEYSYDVGGEIDNTRKLQDSEDISLAKFLERPVKIYQDEWTIGTQFAADILPWGAFLRNKRVANRISNHMLFRGKLHLKVVLNGNSFLYGRMIAAYHPMDGFDDFTYTTYTTPELVRMSQLPHLYLDPTTSQGGEMHLPFFWHENYLDLTLDSMDKIGKLILFEMNPLKHANGATDQVTVTVFAWMTDVSLSGPTNTNINGLIAQSGRESEVDEANKTGMISGPATAISRVARSLSGISAIAPYMMATDKVASAVGAVAKHFGYCAPTVAKSSEPVKPMPTGSLALINVPSNAEKLALDSKNELSIDPRLAGLNGDDTLNIKTIASIESYLTKFDWALGTAPESLLWNSMVDPGMYTTEVGLPDKYYFPACAVAAMPFKLWTGSMKFRFQVVCSAFHRGRLRICYDPNTPNFGNEYNTNFTRIIDIAKEKDFTIEVGMSQVTTYVVSNKAFPSPVSNLYATFPIPGSNFYGNGVLSVHVMNELTTPDSVTDNDIEINVFVSMGDDFEVAEPTGWAVNDFGFYPQSGSEESSGESTPEPSMPIQQKTDVIALGCQNLNDVNKVYLGETVTSFRQLIKRAQHVESVKLCEGLSDTTLVRDTFPSNRGNYVPAYHNATSGPYNYFNQTILGWITNCHAGWRGSLRWKILPFILSNSNEPVTYHIFAGRVPEELQFAGGSIQRDTYTAGGAGANQSQIANRGVQVGANYTLGFAPAMSIDGTSYTNDSLNTGLEIEVPFYSRYRFMPGRFGNMLTNNEFRMHWRIAVRANANGNSTMELLASAGEDFQPYFWVGMPPMYMTTTLPTPL